MATMLRSPFYRQFFTSFNDRQQAEALEALVMSDVDTARDVETLRRCVSQQQVVIDELGALVSVMSKMLVAAGHLDAQVLERRVEAALEERHAPQPELPPVTCALCGRTRPASSTSNTAYGAVCAGGCPPV